MNQNKNPAIDLACCQNDYKDYQEMLRIWCDDIKIHTPHQWFNIFEEIQMP
jgi:hypothetical protein